MAKLSINQQLVAHETISKEALEKNIVDRYKEIEESCEAFKSGTIDKESLRYRCGWAFNGGFTDFLKENNLKLITPSIISRWERFEDDYFQWKNGEQIYSTKGEIWLKYLRNESNGTKAGEEASYLDKEHVFSLMEAFGVPLEYYKPAPEGTAFSMRLFTRFYPELIVGYGDYWVDDGGLLSKDFQIGSEVTLKNRNGLKAIIKITEHLTAEDKRKRRSYSDYIGIGHIEGYTTDRDREIEISVHNGSISGLFTRIDNDDRDVFNSFPLWQDELLYNFEYNKTYWNIVENLIRRFLGDSYSSFDSDDE